MHVFRISLRRLAAAAALALAVVLPASTTALAQSPAPLIRIGMGPDDPGLALVYASQAGYYTRAGLNVEIVKMPGAAAVAAALAGGSLEIGKAATMSIVTAYAKGLPFIVLGNIAMYNADHPDIALLVYAPLPIHTPKDLLGKIMGDISLTDQNAIATFAWLDQHGVDSSTMKYVEVPASAAVAAMEAGRISGSTIYEPNWTAAMATGKVRVLGYPYDAVAHHWSVAVLFSNTKGADEHRDAVGRFLRATADASAYLSAHESEGIPLSAQFSGIDVSLLAKMHHSERIVAIDPADIQPIIELAAKYKVIPKSFNAQDMICTCALRRTK